MQGIDRMTGKKKAQQFLLQFELFEFLHLGNAREVRCWRRILRIESRIVFSATHHVEQVHLTGFAVLSLS